MKGLALFGSAVMLTIAAASVVQIVIIASAMLITDRFVRLTQVV